MTLSYFKCLKCYACTLYGCEYLDDLTKLSFKMCKILSHFDAYCKLTQKNLEPYFEVPSKLLSHHIPLLDLTVVSRGPNMLLQLWQYGSFLSWP